MRKTDVIRHGLLAFFTASAMLFSCSSDKCKDVTCQNGGSCVDGTCNCPTGFTGKNCETSTVKKMTLKVITLTEFPPLKPDGKTWDTNEDDPVSGIHPDIQIRVLIDGQEMSGYSFLSRPDLRDVPADFGDYNRKDLVFEDLKANITLDIRDVEGDFDSFEKMGSIDFKISDYVNSRPTVINLKSADGKYAVVLKPTWE